MFEVFGTRRSYKINDSFYRVNDESTNEGSYEVIPYFQGVEENTGIRRGKWQTGIPKLFESANIKVNYELRGFYRPLPFLINKLSTAMKLPQYPKQTIKAFFDGLKK